MHAGGELMNLYLGKYVPLPGMPAPDPNDLFDILKPVIRF